MPCKNTKNRGGSSGFVPNGSQRLKAAIQASIKEALDAQYVERMAKASWLGRLWLRRKMRAEINRRVATETAKEMPSREALW